MYRKLLHCIMVLPVLAATWRSFGSEVVTTLSPDQVVSWTSLAAMQTAAEQEGEETEATTIDATEE